MYRLIFIFCLAQSLIFAEEWNTVYLASFPRSGNHWVRFLVEEATHIATSSVYRDRNFPHLQNVFPWGAYCTDHGYEGHCRYPTLDDPVLIKTHYPFLKPKTKINPTPKSAICLIRHPIDSFYSFYVYRGGKEDKIDKKSLNEFIHGWRKFYEFWELQPGVQIIRYEDLLANPEIYLNHILQIAGFSFDQEDIDRALAKYPPQGKPLKHNGCYDDGSLDRIKIELSDILKRYNYDAM
ncbi:sulfotransferase domain-containing protein [Criblamydia sequanensis]|uniref:Sulfotransferase domain-containing protein n=1 Tax=Candidatus Criblamydia sequanensis CRIB-18 TaxID=1437425 RepID=A0A090D043_9BACT|nr:sulfotransferase domain-containing protein [Criblamydia sequanensis]CDR34837.1 hypothetical protein CSEC_2031 [Criblamydia sequanensis CRIB-18]